MMRLWRWFAAYVRKGYGDYSEVMTPDRYCCDGMCQQGRYCPLTDKYQEE